jgi:hypothetical protein
VNVKPDAADMIHHDPSPMHEARHRTIRCNPCYVHTVRRVAPPSGGHVVQGVAICDHPRGTLVRVSISDYCANLSGRNFLQPFPVSWSKSYHGAKSNTVAIKHICKAWPYRK